MECPDCMLSPEEDRELRRQVEGEDEIEGTVHIATAADAESARLAAALPPWRRDFDTTDYSYLYLDEDDE